MVSFEEALQIISDNCRPLPATQLPLKEAGGLVLAGDVHSPIAMPPFRQSAMDGYALHIDPGSSVYRLKGEIAAGMDKQVLLKKGEAVRIFTGAMVPDSANAVVQQELVERNEDQLTVPASRIQEGMNIRPAGEQIRTGELALRKDDLLNPAAIGFLAGLGITEVPVHPAPSIGLLVTGNELTEPGQPLPPGRIYESNSLMLRSVLHQFHYTDLRIEKAADTLAETTARLAALSDTTDVIIISGGISVGDYDFVKTALQDIGVQQQFYKISQKPGKPIFFGTKGSKLIFALPGNPASALTCFYMYVLPALNRMSGKPFAGLRKTAFRLSGNYQKKAGFVHFLKAAVSNGNVRILEHQSSAMLDSFALANALLFVPADTEGLAEGEYAEAFLLDP